jgi:hypothetical protein
MHSLIRRAALAVAAVAVLAVAASATADDADAAGWRSNRWVSPTQNIRCAYNPIQGSLTFATASPRRSVTLWWDGSTSRGRGLLPVRGPVFPYGTSWSTYDGDAGCVSYSTGIDCYNDRGGFHIERARISTW